MDISKTARNVILATSIGLATIVGSGCASSIKKATLEGKTTEPIPRELTDAEMLEIRGSPQPNGYGNQLRQIKRSASYHSSPHNLYHP